MERSWVWVPVQALQSGCCRGQLVPPARPPEDGAALQRPNPLPEPQSSVTGRGLARRFQERKEGWVGCHGACAGSGTRRAPIRFGPVIYF